MHGGLLRRPTASRPVPHDPLLLSIFICRRNESDETERVPPLQNRRDETSWVQPRRRHCGFIDARLQVSVHRLSRRARLRESGRCAEGARWRLASKRTTGRAFDMGRTAPCRPEQIDTLLPARRWQGSARCHGEEYGGIEYGRGRVPDPAASSAEFDAKGEVELPHAIAAHAY